MEDTVLVEIPRARRLRKAIAALVVTLAVSASLVWYVYSRDQLGAQTLFLLPLFIIGLFVTYTFWRTTHTKQLTAEAERQSNIRRTSAPQGQMSDDIYAIGAFITGGLVFVGCWIYCIATYGFLLGVGLGWLPSAIVAAIAAALWPLIALVVLLGLGFLAFMLMKSG